MGQTPLALIILENRGNYTNPIHWRTAWACSTLLIINTCIHLSGDYHLLRTCVQADRVIYRSSSPVSRLVHRLRWPSRNEASPKGRTATTQFAANAKPATAQNLTRKKNKLIKILFITQPDLLLRLCLKPARGQMITLCLHIPWLHHCISLCLLIIFEQMSQDTYSVSYGNFIPESVVMQSALLLVLHNDPYFLPWCSIYLLTYML